MKWINFGVNLNTMNCSTRLSSRKLLAEDVSELKN